MGNGELVIPQQCTTPDYYHTDVSAQEIQKNQLKNPIKRPNPNI